MADPPPEEPDPEPTSPPRNLDRRGQMRDTANQRAQAAASDVDARGLVEGTSDGELSQDEELNETTYIEPVKPKPKPKLTHDEKKTLGNRMAPVLAPAVKCMAAEMEKAEKAETATAEEKQKVQEDMMAYVIPTVDNLSKAVDDEREAIVAERSKQKKVAQKLSKEEKEKRTAARLTLSARLRATFHRKANTHLISAKYYNFQHKWAIFIPLQLIVMIIAVTAFLATFFEASKKKRVRQNARILTVIAGVLGIVAGFVNALDRYLDWRTMAQMHTKAAALYSKLKWEVKLANMEDMAQGSGASKFDLSIVKEKLKNLEEHNGDLLVQLQVINVFDEIEAEVQKQVAIHNDEIDKHDQENKVKGKPLPTSSTMRGTLLGLKNPKIDEVESSNILVAAYGKLTSLMMSRTCCSGFPFCLPLPHTILGKAKKETKEEILAIIKGKCPKEYLTDSSLDKDPDMKHCCKCLRRCCCLSL